MLLLLYACAFPVDQSPSCAQYVACLAARDARDGTATDVVRFSPAGDCWGTPRGGELCATACEAGLVFLHDHDATDLVECAP